MVKRTRKTDPLALPARKPDATFADRCVEAIRQFGFDELEYLRHSTSFTQLDIIDFFVRQTKRDVARNRIVDEKNILGHIADGIPPRKYQRSCQRLSIDQNLACGRIIQAKQQINKGRFSGTSWTNHTE